MINQNDEQKLLDFMGGKELIDRRYKSGHPMRNLLVPSKANKKVFNTKMAFKSVYEKDKDWLEQKRGFLVSEDCVESSSAFGELRAYGYLLRANFRILPGCLGKGSDFKVLGNNDEFMYVEVQTKTLAKNSTIDHGSSVQTNNVKVETKITEIAPYGLPDCNKKNDSVGTNMISKICAIKQDETQISDSEPSIIWSDLQNDSHVFSELDHCLPILSQNEYLTSGCIWHALYGWKGACIFDHSAEFDRNIFVMEHDGRFRRSTKIGAFIFSFENATVLMENPWSQNKIPLWFKKEVFSLWKFSLTYSLIDYGNNALEDYVESQRKYLNAIDAVFGKS